MINKLKETIQQASTLLAEQAANINDSVKEKGYQIIEDWVKIIPKMEAYGLEVNSFSVGVSINPSLEVELMGEHSSFSIEQLNKIIEENKANTPLNLVFSTIRTTYNLHKKAGCALVDPLIIKIYVKISPEIRVFIGEPKIV